jgi:hypothetical protein
MDGWAYDLLTNEWQSVTEIFRKSGGESRQEYVRLQMRLFRLIQRHPHNVEKKPVMGNNGKPRATMLYRRKDNRVE